MWMSSSASGMGTTLSPEGGFPIQVKAESQCHSPNLMSPCKESLCSWWCTWSCLCPPSCCQLPKPSARPTFPQQTEGQILPTGLSPCSATLQTQQGGGGAWREQRWKRQEGRVGVLANQETLRLHGAMVGKVPGVSMALAFLWQVALDPSGQICSSITHPDAELVLQGTPFPGERVLEGDLCLVSKG